MSDGVHFGHSPVHHSFDPNSSREISKVRNLQSVFTRGVEDASSQQASSQASSLRGRVSIGPVAAAPKSVSFA